MILIKVKYSGAVPGILRSELRPIVKIGLEQCGVYWHKEYREKHFTHAGAREYGYEPRKGERESRGTKSFKKSYTGRKLAQKKHTDPLVWTGLSRSLTRVRDVRATSKRVRVILRAPALNFKNPNSKINMRDEMTRVSIPERNVLVRLLGRVMDRKIKAIRTTRTVHIR